MAKKKIYLSDEKKKELEGFEDALDLIAEKGSEINNEKELQFEDYEIFDFLEKEILRLEKIDNFFTTHLPIDKRYSQTQKLIEKEHSEAALLREEIVEKMMREDSSLNHFMANLLQKAFS